MPSNIGTPLDKFQLVDFSEDYRARALFSMVPENNTGRLLDVGSGNGIAGHLLRGKYAEIVLSDYSDTLVVALLRKFKKTPSVSVVQVDAKRLPYTDYFDTIIAADIIEHIDDDMVCLKGFFRALRPGGLLFLSVPAIPTLYGRRDAKYGHYRRYTKRGLKRQVGEVGFTVKKVFYWNFIGVAPYWVSEKIFRRELVGPVRTGSVKWASRVLNVFLFWLLRLESRISWLPLGLSLVVIAQKQP